LKDELLGEGCYGKVYKINNINTNEIHAAKILPKSKISNSAKRIQYIRNEICIHRKLNHMNIIKFNKFFEDKNN